MSQLSADRRETWITGIGLVSSLGDGLEANWDALRSGRVNVDLEKYAPWMIHPLAPLNLDSQIPKKGDQRQMEAWQRIGTYAAGLALDSAGIKDNKEILARTDMIVAAGGGERDLDVDAAILTARADARSGVLNERLMNDLRPTLFLAQLSNLLAGNISIVHGVSRSSRTFNMGLDDAGTSILLPPIVAVLFLAGRGGAASFAAVLLADRCFDQSRSNGGRGFHLRAQHAWPAREHCGHGGSLRCPPGHLEGAVEIGETERDRHRFLMRSALRHNAPRGRGAAHGAVPRGRITAGDGGGPDDAGMRRAQNHKSRSGRRSKRRRRRPTHTLPSTRASRETTWPQELAPLHSERPDWDNRTRTRPAPGWRPSWSRPD